VGQIGVTVNGRNYPIACDDGQEEHVTRLAAYIDKRAAELAATVGPVGESRLLVMIGLLVADELSEAYDEVERLQNEVRDAGETIRTQAATALDEKYGTLVEGLAKRIENIAARLESN
jgi:cell division protein ZapA